MPVVVLNFHVSVSWLHPLSQYWLEIQRYCPNGSIAIDSTTGFGGYGTGNGDPLIRVNVPVVRLIRYTTTPSHMLGRTRKFPLGCTAMSQAPFAQYAEFGST